MERNIPITIVGTINALCKEKGISVNRMLEECKLNKSVVDNLKKGSMITADKLSIIADYFSVTTDYLLGKSDDPTPEKELTFDDFTYALYNEQKELTEENKEKLLEMARFFKQQQEKEKREKKER